MPRYSKQNLAPLRLPAGVVAQLTAEGLPDDESGELSFPELSEDEALQSAADALGADAGSLDGHAAKIARGLALAFVTTSEEGQLLVLAEDGTVHHVRDSGQSQQDFASARLANSSVAGLAQSIRAWNALAAEVSELSAPPEDLAKWKAVLGRAAKSVAKADPQAARRDGYWLPRFLRVFREADTAGDDGEITRLVLEAGAQP